MYLDLTSIFVTAAALLCQRVTVNKDVNQHLHNVATNIIIIRHLYEVFQEIKLKANAL